MQLLTVNAGSTSLKASVYSFDSCPNQELVADVDRIGSERASLRIRDSRGAMVVERPLAGVGRTGALQAILSEFGARGYGQAPDAIGHRIVLGGQLFFRPQPISAEMVLELRKLVSVDPDHLPQALEAIDALAASFPRATQVACFDTAFHSRMPRVAKLLALPRSFIDAGLLRYGFHGLSYEYIVESLGRIDPAALDGRVLIAHLGGGASMAAVRGGAPVDTTMGFTPAGGLVMGSRPGDLDPGALVYLLDTGQVALSDLDSLINRQSGLLGVSGVSSDMRDLLALAPHDNNAAEAVDLFVYQATKFAGAMAAAMNGLDTLVFTAGIGEQSATIRDRICAGLEFLGVVLDPDRNARHESIVSVGNARVTVRVMPTDEDAMIARHTYEVVSEERTTNVSV